MDEYCRFCAEKKENLIEIFEKDPLFNWFAEIINQDLHSNINEDCLSQNICYSCLCIVEDFYYFKRKCRGSLLRLEEIWKNNTISENEPNTNGIVDLEVEISESELLKQISDEDDLELHVLEDEIIDDNSIGVTDNNFLCLNYKFKCQECSETFRTFVELAAHQKSHQSYLCTKCGDVYSNKYHFYYHMKKHINENCLFTCEYCSKSFTTKYLLNCHRWMHTGGGTENHECEQCGKKCRTSYELKIHTRFHTQLRQYKCEICSKAFIIKTHLTQHMVTHTGEKKYICNESGCNKTYTTNSSLKKHKDHDHLLDHEKNISCEYCSKKFSMQFILKDHIRKSHKKLIGSTKLKT